MANFPKWSHHLRFLATILYACVLSPIRATCTIHPILLDFMTQIVFTDVS